MARIRAALVAIVAAAGVFGAATQAAQAEGWAAPQVLATASGPVTDIQTIPGAAVAYTAGPTETTERVFVALHSPYARWSAAAPNGFEPAAAISDLGEILRVRVVNDGDTRVTVVWSQVNPSGGDASVYTRRATLSNYVGPYVWGPTETITAHQSLAQDAYPEVGGSHHGDAVLVDDGLHWRGFLADAFVAVPDTADIRHIVLDSTGRLDALSYRRADGGETALEVKTSPSYPGREPLSWGPTTRLGTVVGGTEASAVLGFAEEAFVAWRAPSGLLAATRGYTVPRNYDTWSSAVTIDAAADPPTPRLFLKSYGEVVLAFGDRQVSFPDASSSPAGPTAPVARELEPPAMNAAGRAVQVDTSPAAGGALKASIRPDREQPYGPPTSVLAPGDGVRAYGPASAAVEDRGTAFVGWVRTMDDGASQVGVSPYDVDPPVVDLIDPSVPSTRATLGIPYTAKASAVDLFSQPEIRWSGNGTTAKGPVFTTTFTKVGTYTVAASAVDSVGNVSRASSFRVTVTAPAPSPGILAAQRVIDPISSAEMLDLAVGNGGGAAVAFRGSSANGAGATPDRLWVAVHEKGALPSASTPRGFSLAEPVSPLGRYPITASVGVDAAGNATVVYWIYDNATGGGPGTVFARYRPARGSWSEPQVINAQGTSVIAVLTPELRVAASGRAVLLTDAGLFERAPGATTFTAVPDTADARRVAMNDAGHIAAEFITPSGDAKAGNISVRVKTAGGAWRAPQELGLVYTGSAYAWRNRSSIAITDNGTVVVGWDEGAPDGEGGKPGHGVNVAIRTPGSSFGTGTWTTTEEVNGTTGEPKIGWNLSASVDNARQVAVSWNDGVYTDGSPWKLQALFPGGAPAAKVTAGGALAVSQTAGGRALRVPPGCAGSITARVRPKAGDAFGDLKTVITPTGSESYCGDRAKVGLDDQGNGYIAWDRTYPPAPGTTSGRALIGLSGYDPVAPVITSVAAMPASAGAPVALAAAATDRMSVPTFTWTFGDGSPSVTGDSIAHTYAKAGTYTAKVVARDEAGNQASWTKTVVVAP